MPGVPVPESASALRNGTTAAQHSHRPPPLPVNIVHLVLTVDRHHLVGCATTIRSVMEHARPDASLRFHLSVDGVKESDRARLRDSLRADGRDIEVRFWEFPVGRVRHLIRSRIVSHATYARLFLDDILPADLDRCIYLDSDLLVTRDVVELWETPLAGRTIGAVENLSSSEQEEHRARLGLQAPRYFNAGVLLVDVLRWRERQVMRRSLEAAERVGDRLILHDQDALNCALEGDWTALDPHWNVVATAPTLRPDSAAVFHFMGAPKPWDLDYKGPFGELFAQFRDRTAFRDVAPWYPAWFGRLVTTARRRLPYIPGALRLLRLALHRVGD